MINRILILFFLFVLTGIPANAVVSKEDTSLVKWMSFKEAFEQNKKTPKPFVIDIYTEWCGWCKHMMKTTYSNTGLANYINTNFYPIKFDAETQDTIEYQGVKYFNTSKNPRSTHQLALKLLGQSLSYPSTIFIATNFQFTLLSQGYLEVQKIEPMLIYSLENIFRTTNFDDFKKHYDQVYSAISTGKEMKKFPWLKFNEAQEKSKLSPKKTIVFINTKWCNGCNIMNSTTFNDSTVSDYIKKHYYAVNLDAESRDTINFQGNTFVNDPKTGPFHQFAMAGSKGSLTLPSILLINENNEVIDVLTYYLSPETIQPILEFYGEDQYKKMKWEDFRKNYSNSKAGK